MKSARERIGKLCRLAARERNVLLSAWCLFFVVDLALRLLPMTRLLPRWPVTGAADPSLLPDRIAWLVTLAARYVPWRTTCLTRALVLARVLRREGVEARVCFGVARNTGGLKAHAWLEHRGRVIFGASDEGTYEPLLPAPGAAGSSS